jgi:hypothetical protein
LLKPQRRQLSQHNAASNSSQSHCNSFQTPLVDTTRGDNQYTLIETTGTGTVGGSLVTLTGTEAAVNKRRDYQPQPQRPNSRMEARIVGSTLGLGLSVRSRGPRAAARFVRGNMHTIERGNILVVVFIWRALHKLAKRGVEGEMCVVQLSSHAPLHWRVQRPVLVAVSQ